MSKIPDKRHCIPKRHQLKLTPESQLCLVFEYLEGRGLINIQERAGGQRKKEQAGESPSLEGKAVETEVYKLFCGGSIVRNIWLEKIHMFTRLPDRTGHSYHIRELRMIQAGLLHNRSITILSQLTGRDEDRLQKKINSFRKKSGTPLLERKEK